ncbi:unnamed protein product [Tetraodon nigroviridis]|uniref:(spotted green pufferfish) hypothetical protein n=1 Tax=Tetraodon nigroviridis TaxID=99883 RepID=Q4S9C3_TETNG|nr:unnamed protein product [Tetraodon nigroviridis]
MQSGCSKPSTEHSPVCGCVVAAVVNMCSDLEPVLLEADTGVVCSLTGSEAAAVKRLMREATCSSDASLISRHNTSRSWQTSDGLRRERGVKQTLGGSHRSSLDPLDRGGTDSVSGLNQSVIQPTWYFLFT